MRRLGLIIAVVVATVDGLYIWYVGFVQTGTSDMPWLVPFVASYLGLMAVCALLSAALSAGSWRIALLGASTGGLLVVGFLGLFSIGLPLLVMGLLSILALADAIRSATHRGAVGAFNRRRIGRPPGPAGGIRDHRADHRLPARSRLWRWDRVSDPSLLVHLSERKDDRHIRAVVVEA